jgi:hypothetical protein
MQSSLLFESLFKRNLADTGNAEYLSRIAEEHPYFSPAQFYLLQQKDFNTADYNKQALKTSVLFNNPYWLNFQLLRLRQPANVADENILLNEEGKTSFVTNDTYIQNEIQPQQEIISSENINNNFTQNNHFNQNNIEEDTLIFEPLYTSDYFASQGIKLNEEVEPTDKLGKQLKSFTGWLKTMKKINPDNILTAHSGLTDIVVQTLAAKSNAEGEVLTETMAEIFIQQGKRDKAIETYQKLSLLNPAKSAYFAARIEQLKG